MTRAAATSRAVDPSPLSAQRQGEGSRADHEGASRSTGPTGQHPEPEDDVSGAGAVEEAEDPFPDGLGLLEVWQVTGAFDQFQA